jgi:hypothetical protein
MAVTKEQLAEWAQREAAYYADAEKWKRVEERMKRQHDEQLAEWKRQNTELAKINEAWTKREKDQEEIKKYTQAEIKEAIHQIRIDRIKNILEPYVP